MSLFEQILQTNLINFIIVVLTLAWIFKKAKLGALIEKMAQDVKGRVEKSSADAQSAISEYKATKKSLKDLPVQQNDIMSLAKVNAQNLKEKTEAKTKLQCDEIVKQLDKIILSQKETVKNDTVNEIYQIGVEIAQKTTKSVDFPKMGWYNTQNVGKPQPDTRGVIAVIHVQRKGTPCHERTVSHQSEAQRRTGSACQYARRWPGSRAVCDRW